MNSNVIPLRRLPAGLTRKNAEEWIRAVVMDSKNVGLTDHMRDQMVKRDISSRQVWEVLEGGFVVKDPKWDNEHGDWVCVIRKQTAGRTILVVVALAEKDKMTVVTTYG